ncbi:MAG: phosphodiester glycosidase family protein [Rhodothermaceae bacterium]|nr:phosphodiester glycosidase family protein [Rhodothermaceae bacterium]
MLICGMVLAGLAVPVAGQGGYPGLEDGVWEHVELAPGIAWQYAAFERLNGAPQYINLLVMQADTAARRIRFAASGNTNGIPRVNPDITLDDANYANTRFMRPSEFAARHPALAVVNGGFFSDHPEEVNSGIFKWQGTVWPFTREEPEELRFVGSSAFGLDAGGNWIFKNREDNAWAADWPEAVSALAGAHRLIDGGVIPEPVKSGRWRSAREIRHSGLRHPRTSVCLTNDRYIILLVADGRHRDAIGFTLPELAQLMHHLGCTDAVNLDGGGSSTMYIDGSGVVNHPSDNRVFDREGERPVRTAIVIVRGE